MILDSHQFEIRVFAPRDWMCVREIYREGIETGNATFETEIPDCDLWRQKFYPSLLWVALTNNEVTGWAGLQPVSTRKAYEGVAEVTVYVASNGTGKGVGTRLMNHLIIASEAAGIWSLYSSVFSDNEASIRLHRNTGFREIGYRERIAKLHGLWRNTILFERRSEVTGL